MNEGKNLQEVFDGMAKHYREKSMNATQIVTTLLAMKLANIITDKTMKTITEDILRPEEIQKAIYEAITFAKKDKKTMRGLIELAKKHYA